MYGRFLKNEEQGANKTGSHVGVYAEYWPSVGILGWAG
jgi:hypothetical protein